LRARDFGAAPDKENEMTDKEIRETVLELEQQYWDAMKSRDGKAAARLTADPCIVAGPHGVRQVARDAIAGMVQDSTHELKDYSLDTEHAQVTAIGKDVAILAYPVHERMVVDGKPSSLDAFDLSVWVRRNGQWVCAAHTEAIAQSS
jgi:uncharacterized protein (TIGR02246 family)